MRIKKKVLTKEHQAKLLAGRIAAKARRLEIKISTESKADALAVIDQISDGIRLQLDAVKDDSIAIHKMMVALDRAMLKDDWVKASGIAAAIYTFALNISRRIEACSIQAEIANRLIAAIRVKEKES